MHPEIEHPVFAKFHSSLVVGMLDIVRSTEITMPLSGESIDDFYTIFLQETAAILQHNNARIIKNIGDGILFYFPETVSVGASDIDENSNETQKAFAEVLACANALLSGRAKMNEKLSAANLPTIEHRTSFSFGAVSAMISTEGAIIDLFGSVINTCTKMNKMAKPNTCIVGEALHEKFVSLGIAGSGGEERDGSVFGKIGDYHVGDKLSFGVWQIAQ